MEVKADMIEEYKKFTFPSSAACKSEGRKDKVQELRKKYAAPDSRLLKTRIKMCELYQTYNPMTCDTQA